MHVSNLFPGTRLPWYLHCEIHPLRRVSYMPSLSSATRGTQLRLTWTSGSSRYTILRRTYTFFHETSWAKPAKSKFWLKGRYSVTTERDFWHRPSSSSCQEKKSWSISDGFRRSFTVLV